MALAGAGMISMIHAIAAEAAGVPIVAVASRSKELAAERAGQIGCPSVDYNELPAGADVVLVATPPALHVAQAIDALRAGASVLVEKPLATTLAAADRLVAIADDSSGELVYAENQAFAPVVNEALRLIAELGPLDYLDVRALSPRPNWGDFLQPTWGGGCLFDLGAHPIALALLAAGDDQLESVTAMIDHAADIDVDDHAVVELQFTSGLTARVEASWREATTTWDLQASSGTGVVRAELIPVTGLERNGEPFGLATTPDNVDTFVHDLGYVEQMRQMRSLIIGPSGTSTSDPVDIARLMDGRFGRRVLEIICAAYSQAGRAERGDETPEPIPFRGPRESTPHELWREAAGSSQ